MNKPDITKDMQKLPNRDNHYCFGCSPVNEHGLQMEFYTDRKMVYSDIIVPQHLCGWNSLVHGGVISTILDEIMSWGAIYLARRIIMTKTMTVDYLKPIQVGKKLHVQGSLIEKTSEREAVMEGEIFNEAGDLCARSRGTFALFTIEAIRKMKIMDEEDINALDQVFRQE